ncbi:MAG TPA: radical SAM protein [Firmicutes bacterium]|nr:radical SAM protein [Candidatus Fermentithermobacillaceae bacterium]
MKVLGNSTILNTDTLNLFDVNEAACRAVELVSSGYSRDDVCSTLGCTLQELDELLSKLSEPRSYFPRESQLHDRKRLVLMVSRDCNMRCRYCYAGHGIYGTELPSMTPESAVAIARACVEKIGGPDFYMFFGGEPTMNIAAIGRVFDALGGDNAPQLFGIVTNGTFSRKEIQHLLETHKMTLTFSIDGPQDIHDFLRPYSDGRGSFNTALDNLRWAQQFTRVGVEATFTPDHIKRGYSLVDLIEFFHSIGIDGPHIVPVAPKNGYRGFEPDILIREYRQAIDYCLQSFVEGRPHWYTLLVNILGAFADGRKREYLCPAGVSTLCVDSNGDLYPCFMFVGAAEFLLGNIFHLDKSDFEKRRDTFIRAARKSNRSNCSSCWASNICGGCMGSAFWATGCLTDNDPAWCELQRQTIAYAAQRLAKLHSDQAAWQCFVDTLTKATNDVE